MAANELDKFLFELNHSRASEIESLSRYLVASFPNLKPEIKWNAPSFIMGGVNVVTLRLFPEPILQVVLHCGSKKLTDAPDLRFEVEALQNRWADQTRCVIDLPKGFNNESLFESIAKWLQLLQANHLVK